MNVWSDNVASQGAHEIGSCLLKHTDNFKPPPVKHLTTYCHSCGDETMKSTHSSSHILQRSSMLQFVYQKFCIPGHSSKSCDQEFAVIAKARCVHPRTFLLVPSHWILTIKSSKKTQQKFKVTEMTKGDFFITIPVKNVKINTSPDSKKHEWLNAYWIWHDREYSLVLTAKQPHNEDYEFFTLDLNSQVMGRRQAFSNIVASDTYERKFSVVPVCLKYVRLLVTMRWELLQPKDNKP